MKTCLVVLGCLLGLLVLVVPANPAVPSLINYQGYLTDTLGDPLQGLHTLTFSVYADNAPEATPLWTEVHGSLFLNEGLFHVILGSLTGFPDTLFETSPRWIGIRVDSEAEISPRTELTSVPWALKAATANQATRALIIPATPIAPPEGYPNAYLFVDLNGQLHSTGSMIFRSGQGFGRLVIDPYNESRTDGTHRIYCQQSNETILFSKNTDGSDADVVVDGSLTTDLLVITGGSDIAEPFPVQENPEVQAGSVLVIDGDHPGGLTLSTRPYDRRVAGVVSGAGGVRPGLTLTQEGVIPGGRPVAMSGRVYVLADASYGPIEPGDLLTTSATPGHAMKAADPERSQGAVIGKAMSSLRTGRGLVLVLVNLQ